jgi:hypothetical protein
MLAFETRLLTTFQMRTSSSTNHELKKWEKAKAAEKG